jgi:hypothetical protein
MRIRFPLRFRSQLRPGNITGEGNWDSRFYKYQSNFKNYFEVKKSRAIKNR